MSFLFLGDNMSKIQFSHISKTFSSGTHAVNNFNLEVEDGEFLVIVGSSGCGKSTILCLVAGLEEITTGELKIDEKIINELPPQKCNIAMVFQNYALFPNLIVEENMEFALKMQHISKKERKNKVNTWAKILKVDDIIKRKAKGLSGGQCQRIAIGRALVCEPKIFLMDEPLSNLDASMRTQLRTEIAQLQKQMKITTLYVTHDQTEAMTLGDRVVVMNNGEIMQVDTPQNIYCKPQNIFVAQFFGNSNMNLLKSKCIEYNGSISITINENKVILPDWKSKILIEKGYINKTVIIGIRSEDIYPECNNQYIPDIALSTFEATIKSIDIIGSEKKLHFIVDDMDFIAITKTNSEINIEDNIKLHIATKQIHIFDEETQQSIVH